MAKEFRRRGYTVLFQQAAELKRMVMQKEHFDPEETFWDRAMSVDVLVLDDLGKGVLDSKGFGSSLVDELIRTRSSKQLVTIVTSNVSPRRWDLSYEEEGLDLKKSTMETLKECAMSFQVKGQNRREVSADGLRQIE
jgi:DNA replication protein DnaC